MLSSGEKNSGGSGSPRSSEGSELLHCASESVEHASITHRQINASTYNYLGLESSYNLELIYSTLNLKKKKINTPFFGIHSLCQKRGRRFNAFSFLFGPPKTMSHGIFESIVFLTFFFELGVVLPPALHLGRIAAWHHFVHQVLQSLVRPGDT